MGLSRATIITDIFAILAIVAGAMLAFRQRPVRRWWARMFPTKPDRPLFNTRSEGDPVHHALLISGVMLMAFGVLIFAFTTGYELMTEAPR